MASIVVPSIKSSVNDGRRAPLQGYDTTVYIMDQASGILLPFGEFTGFQHTIRNATEPYLPLGNRSISLLDGEFQIGWVVEQGKINLDVVQDFLGYSYVGPAVRIGRSPRYQIVIEYNAAELNEKGTIPGYVGNDTLGGSGLSNSFNGAPKAGERTTVGRYVFGYCKIDAYTSGAMAGRSVIADRLEGLAEYWTYIPNATPFGQTLNLTVNDGQAANLTANAYKSSLSQLDNAGAGNATNLNSTYNTIPSWATGS